MVTNIRFTPHAEQKLLRLAKVGITKEKVIEAIKNPDKRVDGYWGRKIAQSSLTDELVLRVIHEEINNEILVITIYPGERSRYEDEISI